MVNWEKERTLYEKILIDKLYRKGSKLLKKIIKRELNGRLKLYDKGSIKTLTVFNVGNSHLDSAWLWRKRDTREKKVLPTFSRNIYHLTKEPFTNYTFTANATVHYEWIKEDYPAVFAQIKELVREGRWEIAGGEYVENDCNLVNGESLVRQRLIGQRFYIKEFGKPAVVAWMDDVFGWPGTLPQIIKKSAGEYFYTNKFCYSDYSIAFDKNDKSPNPEHTGGERFPFFHFRWQSPDGSRIICTWAQHKSNFFKHLRYFNLHSRTSKDPEKIFNYGMSWKEMDEACTDEVIPLLINAYGVGDGGMGPTSLDILEKMVWEDISPLGPYSFRNGRTIDFMKSLEPYTARIPIWRDELYLENHRGTLTSVAMIKENNHTAEALFNIAESVSVFSGLVGAERFQEEILDDWKNALFLQFHDVLPGSSIAEVYRDAAEDYRGIFTHLFSVQESGLINCAQIMRTSINRNAFTIYNPLGWKRNKFPYIFIPAKSFTLALDSAKAPLITQRVSFSQFVRNREVQLGFEEVIGEDYLRVEDQSDKLEQSITGSGDILLIKLPDSAMPESFGMRNLFLLQRNTPSMSYDESLPKSIIGESGEYYEIENGRIFVKISKKTGAITHYSRGRDSPNVLGKNGIQYVLYRDNKTKFDAWNIDPEYCTQKFIIPDVEESYIEENGPLRYSIILKHGKTYAGTSIYTRLSFYNDSGVIFGETLINWQEDHRLLKLAVNTAFNTDEINCGAPYGIQKRSTNPKTVYQKAMFEYAYQQFAYWDDKRGQPGQLKRAIFYTQTKYGMSASGGTAEFTFLKAAYFEKPDMKYATLDDDFETRCKIIDHGFHRIPWAIEFTDGSESPTEIVKNAYEYNIPLIGVHSEVSHGDISFVKCSNDNVIIHVIKEIEPWDPENPDWFYQPGMDELAFILRIVEYEGKRSTVKITIHDSIKVKKAFETDLLERIRDDASEPVEIAMDGNSINLEINPFEIKSIMVVCRIALEEDDLGNRAL